MERRKGRKFNKRGSASVRVGKKAPRSSEKKARGREARKEEKLAEVERKESSQK